MTRPTEPLIMMLRIIFGFVALISGATITNVEAQNGDKKGELQTSKVPTNRIPKSPPLQSDQARSQIDIRGPFLIEPIVAEPMVEIPIIAQFDPDGRLWVVEM